LFFIYYWRKKGYESKFFCNHCLNNKRKSFGIVEEERLVLFVNDLPNDAEPIFIRPPTISDSSLNKSVYDIANKQLGDEKVVDKTQHCHNPNFMKDSNYVEFDIKSLEQKDKPIQLKDGLDLLKDLEKSNKKAILEDKKTKGLDYDTL